MFSAAGAITNPYGIQIGTVLRFNKPLQLEFSNQPDVMKQCSDCGRFFPLSEFSHVHRRKCKKCYNIYALKIMHKSGRSNPYNENKKCSRYLGEHISERLLLATFSDVRKAPTNTPGYDFICGKGFKVDVKASCIHNTVMKLASGKTRPYPCWQFHIRFNKTPDYFALIAFDTVESLTPLHYWMIPGEVINNKHGVSVFESTLPKWAKYEKPLDKINLACTTMKEQEVEA